MEPENDLSGALIEGTQDRERAANLQAGLALEQSASAPKAPPGADEMQHQPFHGPQSLNGVGAALAHFTMELPRRSVVGGIRDAANETMLSAYDASKWFYEHPGVPLGGPALSIAGAINQISKAAGTGSVDLPEKPPFELPSVPEPTTTAGKIVRGVTQFLTGYVAANAVLPGMGLAQVPRSLLVGAITQGVAFDPGQQRLSNFLAQFPGVQKPVFEYLSATPGDRSALGRLKAATEGLGLGVATEGLLAGVRLVKSGMDSMYAAGLPEIEGRLLPPAESAPVKAADLSPFSDPKAPLTTVVDASEWKAKLASASEATAEIPPGRLLETGEGRGVFINFNKINTGDDVKKVMQQVADLQSLSTPPGQTWDEIRGRVTAARSLSIASGENVTAHIERAASPTASLIDQFNFRRALAIHAAIDNEVRGIGTEASRILNAFKIPVGAGEEQAKGIQAMMEMVGGTQPTQQLAMSMNRALKAGTLTPEGVGLIARKGWSATTGDALFRLYQSALLSGPHSMAVKTLGDAYIAVTQAPERWAAGQLSKVLPGPGVATDEASQYIFGEIEGAKDVFRWVSKTLRGQDAGELLPAGRLSTAHEFNAVPPISAEAFGADTGHVIDAMTGERAQSMWGAMLDSAGAVTSIPGKAFQGITTAFQAMHYRAELYAQAARQASREAIPEGVDSGAWMKGRIAELIANPSDEAMSTAVDTALHNTMSDPAGKWAKAGMGLQKAGDSTGVPLGRAVLPFIRTPVNILDYQLERTPLAVLQQHTIEDIAKGGAPRALALTRIGTGTAAMLTFMDMALSGQITGGGHPNRSTEMAREREGILPYSIKLGDRWVRMSRAEPLGGTIGMAADIAEFLKWQGETDTDDEQKRSLVAAGIVALSGNIMDKAYLTGLSNTVDAIHDPARFGPKYIKQFAGSLVPAGITSIKQASDPTVRATYDILDAMKARTPGWSTDLPPSRNLWGEPRTGDSGLGWGYDMFSPLASKQEHPTAIDDEIRKLGATISMPSPRVSFNGVALDLTNWPKLMDKYVAQSGNGYKDENRDDLGLKDYLNRLVTGKADESDAYKEMSDGPEGEKASFIKSTIADYRQKVREELYENSPELQREVIRKAIKKGADPGDLQQ